MRIVHPKQIINDPMQKVKKAILKQQHHQLEPQSSDHQQQHISYKIPESFASVLVDEIGEDHGAKVQKRKMRREKYEKQIGKHSDEDDESYTNYDSASDAEESFSSSKKGHLLNEEDLAIQQPSKIRKVLVKPKLQLSPSSPSAVVDDDEKKKQKTIVVKRKKKQFPKAHLNILAVSVNSDGRKVGIANLDPHHHDGDIFNNKLSGKKKKVAKEEGSTLDLKTAIAQAVLKSVNLRSRKEETTEPEVQIKSPNSKSVYYNLVSEIYLGDTDYVSTYKLKPSDQFTEEDKSIISQTSPQQLIQEESIFVPKKQPSQTYDGTPIVFKFRKEEEEPKITPTQDIDDDDLLLNPYNTLSPVKPQQKKKQKTKNDPFKSIKIVKKK